MANKPKQQDRDRRAKVEEMRKAEQAKERRKSMMFVVVAVRRRRRPGRRGRDPVVPRQPERPGEEGAVARSACRPSAASCSAVQTTTDTGDNELGKHVADGTVEKYETSAAVVRPALGQRRPTRRASSTPPGTGREMEQLVHNLEHGYTVVWYDDTIKGDQLEELEGPRGRAPAPRTPSARRQVHRVGVGRRLRRLPEPASTSASRTGARPSGHLQLCGKVSGAAVAGVHQEVPGHRRPRAERPVAAASA